MSRSYFIRTFGCQMNEHDSGRAAGLLEAAGYRRASSERDAELVLLNTCAVRENADNRLYGTLGHLKGLKDQRQAAGEDLTIVVGGCLAQKDGDTVATKAPWVDVVYGTHNLGALPQLLAQADSASLPVVELVEQLETFPSALPAKRDVRHHAWVAISVGCDNSCTFCIVPSLRGGETSRTMGDIVAEVRSLVADGVVEVTLLGQNVNSYGRDLAGRSQFAPLLRELGEVAGLERIRFTSPHPRDFTDEVLHAMAETPTVMPHLHLPLQSGSDRVLRLMRRSYRQRRFLRLVERTRELLPDAALSTDLIVGFPGETEEDFQATLDVVAEVRFDQAFTFQYSPRPGTPAAERVDEFVAEEVVADRYQRLEPLVRRHSLEAHRRLIGTTQELLVESPSKTDGTRWSGRTRGHHLVHFPAPAGWAPGGDPAGWAPGGDPAGWAPGGDPAGWAAEGDPAGWAPGGDPAGRSDGVEPAFAPGDLVTVAVVDGAHNYAVAEAATAVRRTEAGRRTGAAMVRGEGWALPLDAPATAPTTALAGRSLPVIA